MVTSEARHLMSKVQSEWLHPACGITVVAVVGVVRFIADSQISDLQKSTQPPAAPKGHKVKVRVICRNAREIVVIKEVYLSKAFQSYWQKMWCCVSTEPSL